MNGKEQYIYVISLENEKYYIGRTHNCTLNFSLRTNHEFVKKYKQKKLLELIIAKDPTDLDITTIRYMKNYGIDNVRGGSFCSIQLSKRERNLISSAFENEDSPRTLLISKKFGGGQKSTIKSSNQQNKIKLHKMKLAFILFIVVAVLAYTTLNCKNQRDEYAKKLITTSMFLYNIAGEYIIKTDYSSETIDNINKYQNKYGATISDIYFGIYLAYMENENYENAIKITKYIPEPILLRMANEGDAGEG